MSDVIDEYDFSKLLAAIIRQALDDYIKLQHPKYRKKKYLIEAYQHAVDMFFDNTYRFIAVQNDDNEDMSLEEMVKAAMKSNRVDIKKIRDHAIAEAVEFWANKEIKTLEIPESIQINGHVYRVQHHEEPEYQVDYVNKTLTIDKTVINSDNQENFVNAVMEILFYHEEIVMKKSEMDQLSKAWFRTLKLNNCFVGAD